MVEPRTYKIEAPVMSGEDIKSWQNEIKTLFSQFYISCPIVVDGNYGDSTRSFTASLCHALGMNEVVVMLHGLTPELRVRIRNHQLTPSETIQMNQRGPWRNALRQSWSPNITHISAAGVTFIKQFEGFSGKPYDDGTGVWTIGYGHIEGITPRSPHISEPQAAEMLMHDLNNKYAPPVAALQLPLNQNQFDALVSFVYNLGPGVLQSSSSVGSKLRMHDYHGAAEAMLAYDHAGGQRLPGLTRRRQAERALFLKT